MALGIDGYVYRLTQTKIKKQGFEELRTADSVEEPSHERKRNDESHGEEPPPCSSCY